MKHIFFAIAILCSTVALAQDNKQTTTVVRKTITMTGPEASRMFSNVTDRKIYQRDGKVIDSAKAVAMVKSFEYALGYGNIEGQTTMKRMIMKINPKQKLELYQRIKSSSDLKSQKLQDGLTLDLNPMAKRVDTSKLTGKAIIMIFWCPGCYNGTRNNEYFEINELISTYYNPDKLQIIAITNAPFDVAADELKKSPILNARHVFEGSYVTAGYQTENKPVIVMTDKAHKIIFSVAYNTGVTTWMLNKLLKENI